MVVLTSDGGMRGRMQGAKTQEIGGRVRLEDGVFLQYQQCKVART